MPPPYQRPIEQTAGPSYAITRDVLFSTSNSTYKLLEIFRRMRNVDESQFFLNHELKMEGTNEHMLMRSILEKELDEKTSIISPELITYANRTHNYATLGTIDKISLCIARLQTINMQFEYNHQILQSGEKNDILKACCSKCVCEIAPMRQCHVLNCGHVYCGDCMFRTIDICSVCSKTHSTDVKLKFAYNEKWKPICRYCIHELSNEDIIYYYECGDVYCNQCCVKLQNLCMCGKELSAKKLLNLTFN